MAQFCPKRFDRLDDGFVVDGLGAWCNKSLNVLAVSFVLMGVMLPTYPAAGQTNTRPAAIVTVDQCAGDAASQKLLDAFLAMKLSDGTSVAELWSEMPAAEESLHRKLLSERRLGKARRAPDGAIEVDASVPITKANELIADITARFIKDRDASTVQLQPTNLAVLSATGRWQGPPPAPPGPVGWRHCDARQLEQVAAAARIDVRQRLLDAIASWQLSASQRLSEIWAVRPDFRLAIARLIDSLPLGKPTFEDDGLSRLSVRFHRTDIVNLLTTAAKDCSQPIEADLATAIDPEGRDILTIDGFAVAPPFTPQRRQNVPNDANASIRPDWADRLLSTQVPGRSSEQIADANERLRLATAAATVEAKRQLWLQIEQLPLPSGKTVGDLLAGHHNSPAVKAINDAFTVETSPISNDNNTIMITLSIPLETVWQAAADLDTRKK